MKKKFVLKKNWEFKQIIAKKKQLVSKYLVLYYQPNQSNLKMGISISKKFANAVKRNYNRRQVRNIMKDLNFYHKKYDVVLILRKPFLSLDFLIKKKVIKEIFERL